MWYECHGVSKHRHIGCLFNDLFRFTSKKTSKLRIADPLWGKFTCGRWIRITKLFHDVIIWLHADPIMTSLLRESHITCVCCTTIAFRSMSSHWKSNTITVRCLITVLQLTVELRDLVLCCLVWKIGCPSFDVKKLLSITHLSCGLTFNIYWCFWWQHLIVPRH